MATFPASFFELIQVIAAFAIFVFGYVALFCSLMIFLFLAKGLYASAKAVGAYGVRYGSTNSSRPKRFVIPPWKQKLVEATSSTGKN